jgi:hypothetical protein
LIEMVRRLATLILIAAVALAGLVRCPKAMACSVAHRGAHDCCGDKTRLAQPDCCSGAARDASRLPGVSTLDHQEVAGPAAVLAALPAAAPSLPGTASISTPLAASLGPPRSLLSHHTALLL